MNLHMCGKFGANRSSRFVAFPEFVLTLVRLLPAVRRPDHVDIKVTNFLHSNFRSVGWRARGGVNGMLPGCEN